MPFPVPPGADRAVGRRLLLAAASAAWMPLSRADDAYPARPLRFIAPSPPGGGTDTLTRLLAAKLAQALGQPVVAENLPGASGDRGLQAAAAAAPDGHTLVMGESGNLAINPLLSGRPGADLQRELAPVVLVARVPLALVVPASSAHATHADLLLAGRRQALAFASAGDGTVGHLVTRAWGRQVGLPLSPRVFAGGSSAIAGLASGAADFHFASVPAAAAHVRHGLLRALAVTSFGRSALLPDVPSLRELGLQDMEMHVFYGVMVPTGTQQGAIARLNGEINRILRSPDVRPVLSGLGADRQIQGGTPEEFANYLWVERRRWARIVPTSAASGQ